MEDVLDPNSRNTMFLQEEVLHLLINDFDYHTVFVQSMNRPIYFVYSGYLLIDYELIDYDD